MPTLPRCILPLHSNCWAEISTLAASKFAQKKRFPESGTTSRHPSRGQCLAHTLGDDVEQQWVTAQRLREAELDLRVSLRHRVARRRQVAQHMDAGREEIRHQHHTARPLPNAQI